MLQTALAPSPTSAAISTGLSDIVVRSGPIARRMISDSALQRFLVSLQGSYSQNKAVSKEFHPTCRLIAGLFGSLEAHQRPASSDACEAMARIDLLAKILQKAHERSQSCSAGFIKKSITARSLAGVFFPSNIAIWSELINRCLRDAMESLLVYELDRLVGGELVEYLDRELTSTFSIHSAIERDFRMSLSRMTTEVIEFLDFDWFSLDTKAAEKEAIWPVIFQWVHGEEFIPIPSAVNCQRIDWKQITELKSRVVQSIADQPALNTIDQTSKPSKPQPIAESGAPSLGGQSNVGSVREQKTDPIETTAVSNGEANTVEIGNSSSESLTQQYETTVAVKELFSPPAAEHETPQATSVNSPSCDIRSANDPQLAKLLEQLIEGCRITQGTLSLLRIRAISSETGEIIQNHQYKLLEWQAITYKTLKLSCTSAFGAAFLTSDGDFSIVFQDFDRIQTTRLVRSTILPQEFDVIKTARSSGRCGIVCGVATVNRPARTFQFDQLTQAAERCLEGAMLQGRGSIKSLEVY